MSAMASFADETILLISRCGRVVEKARIRGFVYGLDREARCRAVRRAVRESWWEGIVAHSGWVV
jgi:hypothetical protein